VVLKSTKFDVVTLRADNTFGHSTNKSRFNLIHYLSTIIGQTRTQDTSTWHFNNCMPITLKLFLFHSNLQEC